MKKEVVGSLGFLGLDKKELSGLIEIPKDPGMGDYAFPCFTLAKKLKKNPVQIAKEIAGKVKKNEHLEGVEAVGPYVNFFVSGVKLSADVIRKISREGVKYGGGNVKEKVVLEFPSPNTNKPLHLGHARNIILGQSVSRICEFMGNKVKIVNLNNDRGIHICKSLVAYEKFGKGDTPKKAGKKSDHFVGDYYVKFAKEVKENSKLEEEAKECLKKWENGDEKVISLWEKMNVWALDGFEETYRKFQLEFDREYFESKVYKKGKKIILEALKNHVVREKPDGAIYIDLKKGLGEKILLRSDGTSIYVTQDLYLAVLRHNHFGFDKSIYVTANEQDYHFKVLFSLLKRFGYDWAKKLHHLNYGLVHLESGRMKSREGKVVDIDDLLENLKKMATKAIEKRHQGLFADEVADRAFAISMAALRYYFLKIERLRSLTFKPKESLSFEGDTGPYLLYSYARAQSILRKADYKSAKRFSIKEVNDSEKMLASELGRFPRIVKQAYVNLTPNLVANYAFGLAKEFSDFYHNNPVIGSEQEQFRLKLVESFGVVMKNSLYLLGIAVIPEM